jgi:hypothetical protein
VPGGAVLSRTTSVVESSIRVGSSPVDGGSCSTVRIARAAIWASGWRTVVSRGDIHSHMSTLSKPTTLRSCGIRKPRVGLVIDAARLLIRPGEDRRRAVPQSQQGGCGLAAATHVEVPVPDEAPRYRSPGTAHRSFIAGDAFPATIVRPSHTYDDARPPLPGDWTAWERLVHGDEIVVPGDGTNLWTITHASDLAVGLVGLVANYQAVGEDFHITSGEALPWDEIYRTIAAAAGTECRLSHLPTELISVVASEWIWTPLFAGDLGHSAIFDNSKIKRFVPAFHPVVTWPQGVRRLAAWRAGHPDSTRPDPDTDAVMDRLVRARHAAADAVVSGFSG